MKENPNIEELLNSFVDGELTQRERIEVQRLISHDAQIANRLQQLQKCKMLVSSLPSAEAPADVLEEIKTSLEERTLLRRQPERFDARAGARHLLVRRVLAAAAMIGLVAVLGAVVYTIVAPEAGPERPIIVKEVRQPDAEVTEVAPPPTIVAKGFSGRLELKTADFAVVDPLIARAIIDNGLLEKVSPTTQTDESVYTFSCSREALGLLLADLGNIWEKFDSATLFVDSEQFGRQVAVGGVRVEQIAEIVNQDSFENRVKVAKDFAVLNNMAERLPAKETLVAIEDESGDLVLLPKPPKPRLTSGEGRPKKPSQTEDEEKAHLTIVVIGSK